LSTVAIYWLGTLDFLVLLFILLNAIYKPVKVYRRVRTTVRVYTTSVYQNPHYSARTLGTLK